MNNCGSKGRVFVKVIMRILYEEIVRLVREQNVSHMKKGVHINE